jgi:hypothetical protein
LPMFSVMPNCSPNISVILAMIILVCIRFPSDLLAFTESSEMCHTHVPPLFLRMAYT